MKSSVIALIALFTLLLLVACSKTTTSEADDTSNTDLATSVTEVGDMAGSGATGAGRLLEEMDEALEALPRASCSTIAFGSCVSGVLERNFSSPTEGYCTRGPANGIRTFGKAILTFANVTACGFEAVGAADTNTPSITRTLDNHYLQRGASGRKLLIYTGAGTVGGQTIGADDLKDFEGTTRSGGATVKKLTTGKKLTINGIHRRGLTAGGKYTMWHTLYTDADGITVTNAGLDRVMDGTMYVMHNRASRKITKTLTAVTFTAACRFPISGTTAFSWTGGSFTVTWGACGSATVDGAATTLDTESAG